MVHSLASATGAQPKTEGDTSNEPQVKSTGVAGNGSTPAPPTKAGSESSGGSVCLFSSTDELLDLDLDLHRQSTAWCSNQALDNNNNNAPDLTTTTNTNYRTAHTISSIEANSFSIDSDSYNNDKCYSLGTDDSYSQSCAANFPRRSCFSAVNRFWKSATWRTSAKAARLVKMAAKRYYLLITCLGLIIVSCLIASVAISRSVGDLDSEHSDDSGAQVMNVSSTEASLMASPPVEMELRRMEIVDLIECGKTFAFARYRLQAKVPKSSPVYQQQPAFLQQQQRQANSSQVAPRRSDETISDQEDQQMSQSRFILISTPERQEHDSGGEPSDVSVEASESEVSETKINANPTSVTQAPDDITTPTFKVDGTVIPVESKELVALDPTGTEIKPVVPLGTKEARASQKPPETELATLLAIATAERSGENGGPTSAVGLLEPSAELDQTLDPTESAASEMGISSSGIEKTIVDCFIVDTDKRYEQKVAMEDKYRLVAATRKVGFNKMMSTIIECRQLTWNTSPSGIQIKKTPEDQTLAVDMASGSALPAENPTPTQPQDFIRSFFTSWLQGGGLSKSPPASEPLPSPQSSTAQAIEKATTNLGQQVSTSESSANGREQESYQREEEQRRQASYLNMGLSMMSGILPNTLWCGLGDRAANYSELGAEYKVDACCRAHDHCPIRLKPFTTDYGLVNWSVSTRSHCDCDVDFNDCLNGVNSTLSNVIRVLYFRFVGQQCIDVEGRSDSAASGER